jgi:hypothetical protein
VSKNPLFRAGILAVISFGIAIFIVDLLNILWILVWLPIAILLVVAMMFSTQMLLMAIKKRKIIYSQALAIVISSGLIASIYIVPLSTDVRFFLLRPYYEIQLAKVQSGQNVVEIQKEKNLVAFYWYRGVLSNWVGLVYDPTASLSLPKSQNIFSGTVYKIRHLDSGWFICYFS